MRKPLAGLAVLALLLGLAGCARYRSAATIDESGTVSGSVIIGYRPDMIEMAKRLNGPQFDAVGQLKEFVSANATDLTKGIVTVTHYAVDDYTGFETKFEGVTPADYLKLLRPEDPAGVDFTLDHSAGRYTFSAVPAPPKPGQMQLPPEAFKNADVSLSLTFPGPVLSSNGEVDGTTVTWRPDLAKPAKLEATGLAAGGSADQSAAPAPVADEPAEGSGSVTTALLIGGAVVLVGAGLAFGLLRWAR
jgi:hypothetical protein